MAQAHSVTPRSCAQRPATFDTRALQILIAAKVHPALTKLSATVLFLPRAGAPPAPRDRAAARPPLVRPSARGRLGRNSDRSCPGPCGTVKSADDVDVGRVEPEFGEAGHPFRRAPSLRQEEGVAPGPKRAGFLAGWEGGRISRL